MSIRVMSEIWKHSRAAGVDLLVMLALADFSNDQGESYPSLRTLAEKSRLTPRGVCKILDRLEAAGEVRRDRSRGGRNRRTRYFIRLSNSEQHSVNSIQRTANTECGDTQTVNSGSYALNRQGTVNKTESPIPDDSPTTKSKRKLTRPAPAQVRAFEAWYGTYPKHVGRKPALKAWLKLDPDPVLVETIMTATARYADLKAGGEARFTLDPATWINQERWTDETPMSNDNGHAKPPEVKDMGNGWVEVDGRQMDRKMYERRYGQAAT